MKKRYKINFKMASPVAFLQRPLFDGLLNFCYKKWQETNSDNTEFPISQNEHGIYMASQLEFPTEPVKFPESFTELYVGEIIRDTKANLGTPKYDSDYIYFIFETENIDFVRQLVKRYLRFIGKKRSEGNGEIESFSIEEAGEPIRRPVPREHKRDDKTYEVQVRAYKPDYKLPDNKTDCIMMEL